ncbi:MAG: hypothetical protein CBC35_11370 [Planctomycetes bacterium TMED75]|nr:hypothetical protein [Planctomycetaceae bacterium]OUU90633.1 MAG: hypothetical protein CBC35_11370 [Planctomycetes bacterium TMED75]
MGLDGDHLLKRLRPVGGVLRPAPVATPVSPGPEGAFARLITLAESDSIDSQRPMSSPGAHELDEQQLQKIGRACDSLESAGLDDGLVLLGGRAFVVETSGRSIQRELGSADLGSVQSLGGVVLVEGPDSGTDDAEHRASAPVPRLQANTALHPDLLASRIAAEGPAQAP